MTRAEAPSVIRLRVMSFDPVYQCDLLIEATEKLEEMLLAGAVVSLEDDEARARKLPLK